MTVRKKKIRIAIVAGIMLALSSAALCACGGEADENTFVGEVENRQYDRITYNSETYREKLVTEKYKTTGEGVNVDGVLDEEIWQNVYPLSYTMGGVESKLYTAFGEDGLYVATRMDMKAYYRVTRAADSNGGGNFFIAPADKTSRDDKAIQIIYTARGYVMTSRGNASGFETWYVDTYVKTYVDGGWVEEGDGSLRDNGGLVSAGDYVSAEAFVPWSELGLQEKPDRVKIMPQTNYNNNSTGYRIFAGRPAGAYNNPLDWFVFDDEGYVHNDARLEAENPQAEIPVGDGYNNLSKTAAWNFDAIGEEMVKSGNMQQSQFAYFKDIFAENWMIEANVKCESSKGTSADSVGLCAEMPTTVSVATRTPVTFNLPCSDASKGKARWSIYSNTAQTHEGTASVQGAPDVMSGFVNLKLIKTGSVFSAFVNDTYFASRQFDAFAGAAVPGIVASGAVAEFGNMRIVTDAEEIADYLAERDLQTVYLNSNDGGVLSLTCNDNVYENKIALVQRGSEVTLQVKPTALANVVYLVKTFTVNGVDKSAELADGKYVMTVEDSVNVTVEYARAEKPALLSGTIGGGAIDAQSAVIKFIGIDTPSDQSGHVAYTFSNVQQVSEDEAFYAFRIPDGTFRLWLDYNGTKYGECVVRVSGGKIELLDGSGNVSQEIENLDFDVTERPKTLVRNITAWLGYPSIPLPASYFRVGETVTWDGENAQIATFDRVHRTLVPIAAGSFTLTASTDGYSEIYNVTVKAVDKSGNKWQLDAGRTAYAEQLKAKWATDGNADKTTLFIGDSFFDVRNFWTNFYTTYADTDAICAGIGSTTTYDWEQYAETFLQYTAPKNIVVHLGTNNIYSDGDDLQTATENLQRLFMLVHDKLPSAKIYYFAITQRSNTAHETTVSQTNAAMKQWCAGYDWITFLDTEQALTKDMLKDGIHPQLQYYSVFTDALKDSDIDMQAKA